MATEQTAWRYAFGGTLVFAMAVSAYTQFALGVLAPLITEDLGLTRTQLGSLTTAIFIIGGVGAPLAGPLVDLLGGRRVLVMIFVAGALAWLGMAAAPTYVWMLAAVSLAGFVRGASNPVGNQLIVLHVPPGRRGLIMGISKSGAQIGAFVVGVTLPTAALLFGWRGVMAGSLALAGIGLLLAFTVVPRDAGREALRAREAAAGNGDAGPFLKWALPNAFLMGAGTGSVNAYLPLFATERAGMTVARAGVVVSAMALVGIAGRIFWGRQAESFRSTQTPLVLVAAFGALSLGALAVAAGGSAVLVWAGALGFGLTAGSWITVGMLAIIREVPVSVTGRTSGLVLGFFYTGFACSPILFGFIVDATESYLLAWSTGAAAFVAAALVAWGWHVRLRGEAGAREAVSVTPEGRADA
jgi:MFS family permease